jgi:hypothetical protein
MTNKVDLTASAELIFHSEQTRNGDIRGLAGWMH